MLTKMLLAWSVSIVRFEFAKIKTTKIVLHVKSPTFSAAKLRGFTVLVNIAD